jgi:DNA-binding response OmpR family regulator
VTARVALLCPDLLFGSKVEGALRAAGHEVDRYDDADQARDAARSYDVVVVDLNAPEYDGPEIARGLSGVPALGFYSHVDQDTRRRAEDAGFDLVVPRSRMARETAGVLERALGGRNG